MFVAKSRIFKYNSIINTNYLFCLKPIYKNIYSAKGIYIFSLLFILLYICSCELLVIGTKQQIHTTIDLNQNTSFGTVYLFKTELDSNNIPAATRLLAVPPGEKLSALEKYELYDEMSRIKRIISNRSVTMATRDSVADDMYIISLEFDYLRTIKFKTKKINDYWFIIGMNDGISNQ